MKLDEVKEFVAIKHGFKDKILGSAWQFANYITLRKKEQIEMHEEVISILNTKVLEYEEKLRFIPVEENLPKYYGDPFYILVKNKNNEPNLVYIEEHSDIEDIRGCFTHWRSFL